MWKKINTSYLLILFLLLISLFVYRRWLSFDIFYAGDWSYYYKYSLSYFANPSVWFSLNNLGTVYLTLWRLPVDTLQGLIGVLGYGSNVSEKIFVFWPTLLIANISSFLLVRKITKSNIAGFVGAIVFNYNTYFFVINTAFLIYSASAWSSLALYIFILAVEKNKLYLFLLVSLLMFIVGSYDFRILYISIVLTVLYFSYFLFIQRNISGKYFLSSIKNLIIYLACFILLNIYWVLPFLSAHSLVSNAVLQRGLFGNEFSNILYAITLFHPFWTGGHTAYFSPQPISPYFWFIPILAFMGLYLNRKNKNVIFFGFVAMLGIFLTKQTDNPFPSIYPWLFANIPGFNAFREASKFYFLIILGYSVMLGALVHRLDNIYKFNKIVNVKHLVLVIILLIFLSNTVPVINGNISDIYVSKKDIGNYISINNYLIKQNISFRTLWIPTGTNWSYASAKNPIISSAYILSNDWSEIAKKYALQSGNTGEYIMKFMEGNISQNILSLSSIKYIVIPAVDNINNDNIFLAYGKSRSYYLSNIDKVKYLRQIKLDNPKVLLYENTAFRPLVYTTLSKESLYKKLPPLSSKLVFNQISPSEYGFKIDNVGKSFYINFSDTYNVGWKVKIGDFNWLDALLSKNYFLSETNHIDTDVGLNSFYVETYKICKEVRCTKNANGTYNIRGTLYFLPQSYLYLGLILSGTVFIVIFSYLLFILSKNYVKRKK